MTFPRFGSRASALLSAGVAFFVACPTFGQAARNVEQIGTAAMPPVPDNTTPGEASDIWYSNGFTYVGRADNDPRRVEVFDVRIPTAPLLFCPPGEIATTPGSYVEDVLVEGQYLYIAQQDSQADADGVRIHDLGTGATPLCDSSADTFAPTVPSAHNLFVYEHSNGSKYLLVSQNAFMADPTSTCDNGLDDDADTLFDCDDQLPGAENCSQDPACTTGVHVLNIDSPAVPVYVAFWRDPPDPALAYCPLGSAGCSTHHAHAMVVPTPLGPRDVIFVAALFDGVYLLDLTNVETPGFDLQAETLAHFGYTWSTPDADGDTVPDQCDPLGLRNPALYLGPTFNNKSHDAIVTEDGSTIWTTDEIACGGHAQMWDLATVLGTCSDADWCAMDEVTRLGEFRLPPDVATDTTNLIDPTMIHMVHFHDSFCFASWYEEGLRILDVSNPVAPVEIGYFDTVVPNTDGCYENGAPCGSGSANRMLNRGFFGNWGVAWDDCYLYLSERGSPDNNAGPGVVGEEGEMLVLQYTGGPMPPQPLRITKELLSPGDLVASWGDVPFSAAFNVYRGTIDSLFIGRVYDHTAIGSSNCNVSGNVSVIADQFVPPGSPCNNGVDDDLDTFIDCDDTTAGGENCAFEPACPRTNYYYLVTKRSLCDLAAAAPRPEGNYGHDSFGNNRPAALSICP